MTADGGAGRTLKQKIEIAGLVTFWLGVASLVFGGTRDSDGAAFGVFLGIGFGAIAIGVALYSWATAGGEHVPALVCPHCQVRGQVYRTVSTRTGGVDGSKAAGAIMTGGASIWFTGLSGKHNVAEMNCKNCGSEWVVQR